MSRERYVWREGQGCVLVEDAPPPKSVFSIMPDIQPYKSMLHGGMVTSRSQHRNDLRDHGCIEVGNEKMPAPAPVIESSRRELISRQLGDMSDRQANKILNGLRHQYRP